MRWIAMLALVPFALSLAPGPKAPDKAGRQPLWKQVEEAVKKGLPKTAIGRLEPIIAGAIRDRAWPEAIRALGRKIALEGVIQGNKPEEKLTRLAAAIPKMPAPMRPVLHAIRGHWLWQYYQRNRWRFLRRTRTAEPPGQDITTWDLPRIFAEIAKAFEQALAEKEALRKIPIGTYEELLVKGNVPDAYRPTLYDFLAHEALGFYTAGEQAGARPEDAFVLSAADPILGPADAFLAWEVRTSDPASPTYKAVRLFQDLLRFHRKDEDPSAFIDADLARLQFGYNAAAGEEKAARYKAALRRFADRWADHPISARALAALAEVLMGEEAFVEARRVALEGRNRFPESPGGRACHNVIARIEAKSASIRTERVWSRPRPTIDVRYRNVTKVYFRLVPYDWEARLQGSGLRPEWLNDRERKALIGRRPALAWSADLPPTADYRERVESLPAPEDIAPGSYFLLAGHDPEFGPEANQVSFTDVWVSDLAMVVRTRPGKPLTGFVLDAVTGAPIAEARVRAWYRDRNRWLSVPEARTDADGRFVLRVPARKNYLLRADHENQALAAGRTYYINEERPRARRPERTVFFTDRAIYRPGQTIRYKGVCIRADTERDDYRALPGRTLTVVFRDPNKQEIARHTHRTNGYGSFSGSFTAPRGRLTGRMTIRVEGGPRGAVSVQVEEYKRPKFRVTLKPPATAPKLGGEAVVRGEAMAYTGAPVDAARVRWRVVREVRFPPWWRWCYGWWPVPRREAQEIAHGTGETAQDGSFAVRFIARPDPAVAPEEEPVFHFTVRADVTDAAGETRTGTRTIRVGYTALQASMEAAAWQVVGQPVRVAVHTRTLDGEGQRAEGKVAVYRLRQSERVVRPSWTGVPIPRRRAGGPAGPKPDLSDPRAWPLGERVAEQGFTTDADGNATLDFDLGPGPYRAILQTQDPFGKPVSARLPIRVLDPDADRLPIKVASFLAAPAWRLEPGGTFTAVWGSGYETAQAYIEVEHRGKILQARWTAPRRTQVRIEQKVTEAMRGGFTLRITMVRENRAYLVTRHVEVPWTNKQLAIAWEHFLSKLTPGGRETWTAVIKGPDARGAVAEMVAALYDASLDAFLRHRWPQALAGFRTDASRLRSQFQNGPRGLMRIYGGWPVDSKDARVRYRAFPPEIISGYMYYGRAKAMRGLAGRGAAPGAPPMAQARGFPTEGLGMNGAVAEAKGVGRPMAAAEGAAMDKAERARAGKAGGEEAGGPAGPALAQIVPRRILNETAFFFPHLVSGEDGVVRVEFTVPEALTEWRFLGFAHDARLRSGYLEDRAVTAKDLMVQPNPPRFLREGDVLAFTVKVTNQSAARLRGTVRLTFADARTGEAVDAALGNARADQAFDVPAKASRSCAWRITVPDGMGFLVYKAVASTGRLADGEEGYLPVLPRRIPVTESLPLPIRGPATKTFDFARLREAGRSKTLRHTSLVVQMVSNPAWYAVMALPYLMEFPHECSEQVFNRLYANALARHIAAGDPRIRRIFQQWKGTEALASPLEKNEDLKAVALEETPWVRQAQSESEARRNVGVLFDENRMRDELARAWRKLADMQRADGAWPWFPGGPTNDYITLYIVTGFGRLRHLGVEDVDVKPAVKALGRLDGWIDRIYRRILEKGNKEAPNLTPTIALYLYGRSFFLEDRPIPKAAREAVDYFLGQARAHWLKLACRQSQGHLAIALKRFGDAATARAILRSIRERAVTDEGLGMFWRDTEHSWWWYRAPIETQTVMIEAFDEVAGDAEAVEVCKVWLLKQKQTQDWKTTKATADAVYALLLRGRDLLASAALVQIRLGDRTIQPERVEAGTGFYEKRFTPAEITPALARITVKKTDPGVAWGSVHWQYLEDMTKVRAYEGTPLRLRKALYVRRHTKAGPVLQPLRGPLAVGDELVVRLVLRVDRDMEYVHLKDQRGSGTEPVHVLSRYRYQDGLAYYESTRDTATHFFIDYLPKGTYVFEYPVRVVHRGRYQSGIARIQCMYAPEFNSHSESFTLQVK